MAGTFSPLRMTAATEEAAISQALSIVGASREEVSVEVVSQDAKGVTVRVSPRRDDEPAQESQAQESQAEATATFDADADSETGEYEQADADEDQAEETEESDSAQAEEPGAEIEEPIAPRAERPAPLPVRPLDPALAERAVATAQQFLDRMGMDARASAGEGGATDEAQRLNVDIAGEDVGILIGKHGQTLQAFQYLLNITLNNRQGEESALRVTVDAGGYRSRRADSLAQVARDAAARCLRDRRPVRMEPMPAHERRLVHMALQEDTTIATSSEGREPMRYVVIAPAGYRAPEGGERGGGFSRDGNRGGFGGNRGGGNRGGGNRGGSSSRAR